MTDTSARPKVTIADVAQSAGVSVPTVSKVLNGRPDVSSETRDRVQRTIDAHGYRPRRQGTGDGSRAHLVDLVLSDLDSPWGLEVLAGAERAAARAGTGLVVTAMHGHEAGGRAWLDTLASRRSAGLVLVVSRPASETAKLLARLRTPLVLLDPVGDSDHGLPTVGATNFAGGVSATEHLLGLGHRRVAVISGMPFLVCSQERVDGYRAALGRAGLGVDEQLVRYGDFRAEAGRRIMGELLDLPDPPTAVFAGSDMQASGVYQEARARGLAVPGDLSVVGFDDLSICRFLSPPLTTVRQPLTEMAAEAVRMALELGQHGPTGTPTHLQLATRLVLRESTARPRPT